MSAPASNETLNRILVHVGRSLLQYVGECWPWTEKRDEAERRVVAEAVYKQRDGVQRLVDLLSERRAGLDLGAYPTEYTDLHFVELDYLLPQLVESERALVGDLQVAIESCVDDVEAAALLGTILEDQRVIVGELEGLLGTRTTDSAA